jgi:hypothetical protein
VPFAGPVGDDGFATSLPKSPDPGGPKALGAPPCLACETVFQPSFWAAAFLRASLARSKSFLLFLFSGFERSSFTLRLYSSVSGFLGCLGGILIEYLACFFYDFVVDKVRYVLRLEGRLLDCRRSHYIRSKASYLYAKNYRHF